MLLVHVTCVVVSPGFSLDQVVKCRNKIGQTYSFMEIRKGVRLVGNNKKKEKNKLKRRK